MKDYKPEKNLLENRIILVTGAGSGIGKAAAKAYARHGATVILLDRNHKKIEEVYDFIESNNWPEPVLFPMDLATATSEHYSGLAAALGQEFSQLDGLLNNAGILGTLTPMQLYDDKLWHKIMQVNLRAPYELTRACFPLLQKSADASVIFTSAAVGRKGKAYWGAYGIAAFATEGMVQIWADEVEDAGNIRINAIDPGAVNTSLRARVFPGDKPGSLPEPEEIMNIYLYLMGPDSKGMNGQSIEAQPQQE